MFNLKCRMHWALSLFCLCSLSSASLAQSAQNAQPIRIEANSMQLDQHRGLAVYRGQVRLQQGEEEILADTLTLKRFDDESGIEWIFAEGAPARFLQPASFSDASARQIKYFPKSREVFLKGQAVLSQKGDQLSAEQIQINLNTQHVSADKAETGHRVQIVLEPKNP
jgi:lipopolysaccharide export system protein LptA